MRTDRWLIASLVLLVSGVWSLFEWCHGTAGLNFAYPVAGTKLSIDITSTGAPVLAGIPLVFFGLLFLLIALLAALLALFRPSVRPSKPAEPTPSTSVSKTS
jgi:hypothetical protein